MFCQESFKNQCKYSSINSCRNNPQEIFTNDSPKSSSGDFFTDSSRHFFRVPSFAVAGNFPIFFYERCLQEFYKKKNPQEFFQRGFFVQILSEIRSNFSRNSVRYSCNNPFKDLSQPSGILPKFNPRIFPEVLSRILPEIPPGILPIISLRILQYNKDLLDYISTKDFFQQFL